MDKPYLDTSVLCQVFSSNGCVFAFLCEQARARIPVRKLRLWCTVRPLVLLRGLSYLFLHLLSTCAVAASLSLVPGPLITVYVPHGIPLLAVVRVVSRPPSARSAVTALQASVCKIKWGQRTFIYFVRGSITVQLFPL